MDHGSRNGFPANEKVDRRIAYDGRATRERRINHLLGSSKRGHQCRPDDKEGRGSKYPFISSAGHCEAHTVVVIIDQPIKQMLSNLEVTGRLLKWSFELEEHDIQHRPRISVKGQILADFIVERLEDNLEDTLMEGTKELPDP
ncbi:hypothetical protein Tco_0537196 [Tanacetum coccineum]